ncbi:putative OmpA/MotB domain-containing protein [Magnetofaba australis IT-1]|uniref:Peptidoglycan-associated protein n=1 Tax=Magnetofaba australis IT-1 TaxID=1434232 RepID=A0A1Y2K1C5_9PROT|nr:putative OmpA/MotB domain-containing protein [Magnetofaba australis IT-1]
MPKEGPNDGGDPSGLTQDEMYANDPNGQSVRRPGANGAGLNDRPGFDLDGGRYGQNGAAANGMHGAAVAPSEPRIYFGYDSADLTPEAQRVLSGAAQWLIAKGAGSLKVEGHCDERGTRDYNLALGQKRADAVKDFLVSQGMDYSIIRTVSYGKERPLVNGHNDAAWARNRRAELVY